MTQTDTTQARRANAWRHGLAAATLLDYDPGVYGALLSHCPKPISPTVHWTLEDITRCEAQAAEAQRAWDAEVDRLQAQVKDFQREEASALGAAKNADACADLRDNIAWLGLRHSAYRPPDLNFLARQFWRYARQKSALHHYLDALRKIERYMERLETRRRNALQALGMAFHNFGEGERV